VKGEQKGGKRGRKTHPRYKRSFHSRNVKKAVGGKKGRETTTSESAKGEEPLLGEKEAREAKEKSDKKRKNHDMHTNLSEEENQKGKKIPKERGQVNVVQKGTTF